MKQKISILVISIAVAMSIIPAGACATALPAKALKAECQEKTPMEEGLTMPASGKCHVTSCPAKENPLFLLPETTSRRADNENRYPDLLPVISAGAQISIKPGNFQTCSFVPNPSLIFPPPPLFCLYCVYIC